jgi:hypothetical protein
MTQIKGSRLDWVCPAFPAHFGALTGRFVAPYID